MTETTTHQKPSPGHPSRRQGRNNGRAAAQKAYASESDMVAVDPSRYNNSPQTPRKANYNNNGGGQSGNSKQRSQHNNSARQRNFASSGHESDQAPQNMTPQRPRSQGKAPSSMAFAGSTFHSSPAPDAIPMPSFLSKAVNSPLAKPSPSRAAQQPTPPATNDPVPSTRPRQQSGACNNDSPLNFMFEAHRREKERQQSSSQGGTTSNNNSPVPTGFQKVTSPPSARPTPSRHHSSGALDGDEFGDNYGQPTGPAFATPFSERMRAARPTQPHPQHPQMVSHQSSQHQRFPQPHHQHPTQPQYQQHPQTQQSAPVDPTEALKRMLFSGGNGQSELGAPAAASQSSRPTLSELGATPTPPSQPSMSDGFNLHERIRQELRLDSQPQAPNTQRHLFSQ